MRAGIRGEAHLRVTLVSKACVVGAYQVKLEEMARHAGVELTVVVPPFWREGAQRLALERAHTQGYRLMVAPMTLNGSYHAHFYPTLPAILAESRPDLCHMDEEPYNLATYLALRAARPAGARVVFFTWQNILRRYPWPFGAMERHTYRLADGAIAGNQAAAQVLRDKGYRGPLTVIPQFGVDPDLFRRRPESEADRPFTVGFAGRLEERKGLGTLAEALTNLGGEWRLVLVGRGPWGAPLLARLAQAGLSDRVTQHGHVPSEEMPAYLARMDALVLPSLTCPNWKEQFGRVLIEAMACQAPVIGSDSGEIPHVIGDAGLVFPEGDSSALRDCLSLLRDDPSLRRTLAVKGRERVLARYTQAHIAAQTVAFYREVLGL
jgi:glycosyltransferase involved in cell wall biosynthesis